MVYILLYLKIISIISCQLMGHPYLQAHFHHSPLALLHLQTSIKIVAQGMSVKLYFPFNFFPAESWITFGDWSFNTQKNTFQTCLHSHVKGRAVRMPTKRLSKSRRPTPFSFFSSCDFVLLLDKVILFDSANLF